MCLTCKIVGGSISPVGGIIYQDDYVILHHCLDVNIAGYLIVSPVRHIENYSDLNVNELQRFGTILQAAATILQEINDVEKVYMTSFGEETSHFHMHVFPRYKWMVGWPDADIYSDNKLDGAKVFSFCRKKYKVEPYFMQQRNILDMIEHIKTIFPRLDE